MGLCFSGRKFLVKIGACGGAFGVLIITSAFAQAMVVYSKEEALEIAFPVAEEVVAKRFFLTAEELTQVAERARVEMDSK